MTWLHKDITDILAEGSAGNHNLVKWKREKKQFEFPGTTDDTRIVFYQTRNITHPIALGHVFGKNE
jgi:hypothetical protein